MRIAVAQPQTTPYDLASNTAHHAELVRRADADVVVFPELSLTGYHFDAKAIEPADARLKPLADVCKDTGTLALVGAPVSTDEQRFIAMLAISESIRVAYRKRYLGSDEKAHFSAGSAPAVVERDGVRLGLAICKDTGIDEHAQATCALGIDIYVAGVLEHEHDTEIIEDRAQRIAKTHGISVAFASFAGSTGEGFDVAAGRSGIWRPDGTVAIRAGSAADELAVAAV